MILKPQIPFHGGQSVALAAALFLSPCPLLAKTVPEVASPVRLDYEELESRHRDSPEFQAFQARLRLIEEVRGDLERAFEQRRVEALDRLLDDTMNLPELESPEVVQPGAASPRDDAVSLLRRYAIRFAEPLPASGFDPREQAALRERYNLAIERAGVLIAEKGRSVAAAKPQEAMQAMALSLVLPLLHVPDSAWADSDVERLPAWIREPQNLRQLEDFALRAHRPLTAYVFAEQAHRLGEGANPPTDLRSYLQATADRLLRSDRYNEAVSTLRAALELAEGAGDVPAVASLRFRIAQVLDDTGHSQNAAAEVVHVLQSPAEPDDWGKAAMLRLKYLYGSGQHDAVMQESERYRGDERVVAYLPQVLYITWVSARQGDRPQAAEQAKKLFLAEFPDHTLGADLYFAEAMEALARSDYDEAARVLEYISYRYPQSRLIKRVQEIQKRLAENQPSALTEPEPVTASK